MIKKFVLETVAVIALIGAPSLYGRPAHAQEPAKPAAGGTAAVSDKDLSAFAKAYVEYHNIR